MVYTFYIELQTWLLLWMGIGWEVGQWSGEGD